MRHTTRCTWQEGFKILHPVFATYKSSDKVTICRSDAVPAGITIAARQKQTAHGLAEAVMLSLAAGSDLKTNSSSCRQKYLEMKNVRIENRTIKSIERLRDGSDPYVDPSLPTHPEHDLFRVNFAYGASVIRNAFFADFPSVQKSDLGAQTGVKLYGGKLAADNFKGLVTNIPGIYAIGDANADNVTNVPHAFYTGKRTAVYLHVQLERENAAAQLASAGSSRRTVESTDMKALWARINEAGDVTYAGEFDQ